MKLNKGDVIKPIKRFAGSSPFNVRFIGVELVVVEVKDDVSVLIELDPTAPLEQYWNRPGCAQVCRHTWEDGSHYELVKRGEPLNPEVEAIYTMGYRR